MARPVDPDYGSGLHMQPNFLDPPHAVVLELYVLKYNIPRWQPDIEPDVSLQSKKQPGGFEDDEWTCGSPLS